MADVKTLMEKLSITEAEAIELQKADKEIDKMTMKQVDSDLSADQKKVIKQSRRADNKPTAYKFTKREIKKDDEKLSIIKKLFECAETMGDACVVSDAREISLTIDGNHYSIVLTKHRK